MRAPEIAWAMLPLLEKFSKVLLPPCGSRFRNLSRHRKLEEGFYLVRRRASWRKMAVTLLKWALIFFVVSVIAGVLGFTGISAASADVARFLFYVFVVIFLVLLILGLTIFRV
jgi:uncharacterized membrane protein YtjA (UPF0391 family)